MKYKYLGTNICFYLGCLHFISGFSPPMSEHIKYTISGLIIILCSKAYKSAKMRLNGDQENSNIRVAIETGAVVVSFLLVALQNNLGNIIYADPLPNLIIPIISIAPYIYIRFKKKDSAKLLNSHSLESD